MLEFSNFKKKVSVKISPGDVSIDNIVFRLHYTITVWFLIACVVLVGSREFIKEHINCLEEKHLKHVIHTYCFFSTTFTVIKHHNYNNDSSIAHPGVGPYIIDKEPIIRHAYYQWVPFVLLGQAILFYIPHLVWKSLENKRLAGIVHFIHPRRLITKNDRKIKEHTLESEESRKKKMDWLEKYLSLDGFKVNRDWAIYLVICEMLNAANLLLQIMLVDRFLQGNFIGLGIKWLRDDVQVLDMVFPKVTKCIFHKYGASGSLQVHDTICVMALNIINEKIYCILWFWFLALYIVTFGGLVWRVLTVLLHKRSPAFNKWIWGELSPGPAIRAQDIVILTNSLCFSDWLFLYYLGKNIDSDMFRSVVSRVSENLRIELKPVQKQYILVEPSLLQRSHENGNESC